MRKLRHEKMTSRLVSSRWVTCTRVYAHRTPWIRDFAKASANWASQACTVPPGVPFIVSITEAATDKRASTQKPQIKAAGAAANAGCGHGLRAQTAGAGYGRGLWGEGAGCGHGLWALAVRIGCARASGRLRSGCGRTAVVVCGGLWAWSVDGLQARTVDACCNLE